MNVVIVPPGQSLITHILAHLEEKDGDYSSYLVVFPGKRPSHFLRKAVALRTGSSFIPPTALSMDEFIDSLYDISGSRHIEAIDAVALLYDIHRKSPHPLGGRGFLTPEGFFPLGLKIYRDIEELAIEDVGPQKVREVETLITDGLPEQTKGRLQSLSLFNEKFYGEVKARGLSSRSMRYRAVAEQIGDAGLGIYDKAIFAGFFALTQAEKILFRRLLAIDKAVFIFEEATGLGGKLRDLGISYEGGEKEPSRAVVNFYSSPDTHGQVMALGNILSRQIESEGLPDEKTVIVVPSPDSLFPLLRQGLSGMPDDAYNVSLGYPLHRTPVFGFLNNLMDLLNSMDGERVYIPDYLKFVLHPYTKNIYYAGKSETTRILFHSVEEELLKYRTKTFVPLAEIEENEDLFDDVIRKLAGNWQWGGREDLRAHLKKIHKNTIERFLSFEDVGDFARKCMDLLVYIFNESTARLHPLFYPFAESFITHLALLPGSLMRDIAFAERSSYFIFLRRYVKTCHTPFTGTPLKGLQVLGFLETRNLKFDRVLVLDSNEDVLPDTKKEETLLPLKARQILGLPTYMDRDRLTAHYFESLLSGAKEVHLFFAENDKTEPSRFVEKLLWERQKKARATTSQPYVSPVCYQVKLVNEIPAPVAKTVEMVSFLRDYQYSATTLNRYLRCPLQFYYATVLGLNPKDEITGDIGRDDLGSFVHDILRRFFVNKKGRQLKEEDLSVGEMASLVDALFEKQYGSEPTGALYLLRRQVKRRMTEILKNYYLPLLKKASLCIMEVEESIAARVGGFNLKGRIDSVEQRGGKTVIVDFKTGSSGNFLKIDMDKLDLTRRETWSGAIRSLQLPFYLTLYAEKKKRPVEGLNALFLLLGRSRISEEIEIPLFDGPNEKEVFPPLRSVIFDLLAEIADLRVPFLPAGDMKNACPGCDFRYVCGTQWMVK